MNIRTDIYAMNARRNMKNTGAVQRRAANRLASGHRINSAADDAAGLAISETMAAQIRGLRQAGNNVQDGMNLLYTMEGGMNEISAMLIRQRELIIQGLNDTNTEANRAQIQLEINQLTAEINSIANRVQYNTIYLLNVGGAAPSLSVNSSVNPINLDSSTSLWGVDDVGNNVLAMSLSGISFVINTTIGTFYSHGTFEFTPMPPTRP